MIIVVVPGATRVAQTGNVVSAIIIVRLIVESFVTADNVFVKGLIDFHQLLKIFMAAFLFCLL
jgi:hypothetical protein